MTKTLSELTDEELSRWIAEKMEPQPVGFDGLHLDDFTEWWVLKNDDNTGGSEWQPRSIEDPAMFAMLVKHPDFVVIEQCPDGTYLASFHNGPERRMRRAAFNEQPERAVALAYRKAHKLEVKP